MLTTLLLTILGLGPLHAGGYTGSGVTVAMIDAGFFRSNDPSVFDQSHILGAYDLLPADRGNGGMFDDPGNYHGTCCLSTMLYRDSAFVGTAPDADYWLIRTEDVLREDTSEVSRLITALLLADSLDADVVTVSLGYYQFDDTTCNYTWDDLDGSSRLSQVANDVASRRIVCFAAGNMGNKDWNRILLPADAENVLACGAVDSLGNAAAFSSWGPTADGRIKPDLSAWGQNTRIYRSEKTDRGYTGGMSTGNGTSFSTPEIAGMMVCLRQALPTLSVAELTDAVIRSCDRYTTPDMHIGHGVPDAALAYSIATATSLTEPVGHRSADASRGLIWHRGQWIIEKNGEKYTVLGQKL